MFFDEIDRYRLYSIDGRSVPVNDQFGEYVKYSDHIEVTRKSKAMTKRLMGILYLFTSYKVRIHKWVLIPLIKISLARHVLGHIRRVTR